MRAALPLLVMGRVVVAMVVLAVVLLSTSILLLLVLRLVAAFFELVLCLNHISQHKHINYDLAVHSLSSPRKRRQAFR